MNKSINNVPIGQDKKGAYCYRLSGPIGAPKRIGYLKGKCHKILDVSNASFEFFHANSRYVGKSLKFKIIDTLNCKLTSLVSEVKIYVLRWHAEVCLKI